MAAASTLSRPGETNNAGVFDALFLRVFGNEVLSQFREINVFMPLHRVKTVSGGMKSATFPAIGTATADWHIPGQNIIEDGTYLKKILSADREIFVDDLLIAPTMVDDLESMKNHFDDRAEYSSALGRALALESDIHVSSTIRAAALSAATVTGGNGGENVTVTGTGGTGTGSAIADGIFEAVEALDEKEVHEDGRFAAFRPPEYYKLVRGSPEHLNRDFGNEGNGSTKEGTVLKVGGAVIVKARNMAKSDDDLVTDDGANNDPFGGAGIGYNSDSSLNVGLVWHPSCVGTVKMADLAVESAYKVEYQSTLVLAKYAMGHGILRPESAATLQTAS